MVEKKDSGLPWLGDVPADWEIKTIKDEYGVVLGKMLQPMQETPTDTLESYLCAINIRWSGIDTAVHKKMWFSPSDKQKYLLEDGDVIVVEGGMAGTTAIYNGEFAPCYMQNAVNRCRTKGKSNNAFLRYWLELHGFLPAPFTRLRAWFFTLYFRMWAAKSRPPRLSAYSVV